MKKLFTIILPTIIIALICISCSNSDNVTEPAFPQDDQIIAGTSESDTMIFGMWNASIDTEKMEIVLTDSRESANFNFTSYLTSCPGGCFKIYLKWIDGLTLQLETIVQNPINISPYDVRIIFENLDGKVMIEPDGYTDLFDSPGGVPANPFYYYNDGIDPDRRFPAGPGSYIYRDIDVDLEHYTSWDFDVIAVCGFAHIQDVVEMTSFETTGHIDSSGGTMQVKAGFLDWQNDMAIAILQATVTEGSNVPMIYNPGSEKWECDLNNSMGADAGTYNMLISAYSPNTHGATYYNFVDIEVGHQPGEEQFAYLDNFFSTVTWSDMEGDPYQYKTPTQSMFNYLCGDKTYVYSSSLNYIYGRANYLHEIGGETKAIWILGEFEGASDDGSTAVYEWNSRVWAILNYGTQYFRASYSETELTPCISGDGSRIAYITFDTGETDIAYRDVASINTEVYLLPNNGIQETDPVLTHDGDIVYMRGRVLPDLSYDLYKFVISSNQISVIHHPVEDVHVKDIQTSMDGTMVMFLQESAVGSDRYNVYMYRENLSPHIIAITSDAGGDIGYWWPDINADGTMLLFNRLDRGTISTEYYLSNADGTGLTLVQSTTVCVGMTFNAY